MTKSRMAPMLWLALPMAAAGLLACNALSGVSDYEFGAAGWTATASGAGGSAGSAGAGGAAGASGGSTTTGSGVGGGGVGGGGVGGGGVGGAPLSWTVVDTLTVPADGSDVVSTFVLQNGVGYRLRASGTCIVRQGDEGDAEWYDFTDPKTLDTNLTIDVGIGIDDPIVDGTKTPDWGPYTASHVYEVEFAGKGAPITANYHDPVYSNNSGELTVEVLAFQ